MIIISVRIFFFCFSFEYRYSAEEDANSKQEIDEEVDDDGAATKDSDSKPAAEPKDPDALDRPSSSGKMRIETIPH